MYFERRAERRRSMKSFADSVHHHVINPLSQIESVAFDEPLDAPERIRQIQAILIDEPEQRQQVMGFEKSLGGGGSLISSVNG